MTSEWIFVRVKQGTMHGLLGKYYTWSGDNPPDKFDEKNLKLVRVDPEINFVWWDKPAEQVPHEYFGVEWSGLLHVPVEGLYRFYVVSDDGCRLWIDGELVIDAWKDQAPTVYHSDLLELSAGYHKILIRFYNRYAFAVIQLGWIRPDGYTGIIASDNLLCRLGDKVEVKGLRENYKVELWCGKKIGEGYANSKGIAVIDVSKLEKPVDGYLRVYDDRGELVLESPVIRDLWGGDRFNLVRKG